MSMRRSEPEMSAFLHARGYRLGLPIGGTFELTARCNFGCPMCYVHLQNADPAKELSAKQWLEIGRQARDTGMMFLLLTGGEPFIRKDFFEIYSGLKALGLMVSINSNGSMLKGEILEKLIEDPPFRINISLYGGCSQTYRDMCGQDAFDQVVDSIRALKKAGVDVRLNVSITPYNCQDLEKIYRISQELGVHMKATSYMYPPIRVGNDLSHRLTAEEAAWYAVEWDRLRLPKDQFTQRAQALCRFEADTQRECAADLDEGVGCRAGSTSFWITWDGRMLPCGMLPGKGLQTSELGFDEAWRLTREATKAIRMPAQCTACPKREICSVCAAVAVTETGDFGTAPEYTCRMTEETIRLMGNFARGEEYGN